MRIAPTLIVLVACTMLASGQCTGPNCHVVPGGDVYDGMHGPLLSGHVYVMTGIHDIPAGQTLTVQAGAVVKFVNTGSLPRNLNVYGTLTVNGTAGSPVTMTSENDDIGGDTNGSPTPPAPGDWKGITINAGSTVSITHATIRYAGRSNFPVISMLTSSVTLSHVTMSDCDADCLDVNSKLPTVSDCAFVNCFRPTRECPLTGLENFTNNTSSGNSVTDEIALSFQGSSWDLPGQHVWSVANTMNGSGVVIMEVSPHVLPGASLTLGPGMIVKGANFSWGLNVSGTLICNGTPGTPVRFTHIDDDAIGGDTMKDGPTTATPGAWGAINFGANAGASSLSWVEARYGGGGAAQGTITLNGASITLSDSIVESSAKAGLWVSSAVPVVTNCQFNNGQSAVTGIGINGLTSFTGNTATGNSAGDYLAISGGTLTAGTLTLGPSNALGPPGGTGAFVLAGSFTVGSAATLQLLPGTIFKAAGGYTISIAGTLLAQGTPGPSGEILFTSLEDDTGGDTNNDGNATLPSPGDWAGLKLTSNADASILAWCRIRYGGAGSNMANLFLNGADITMSDCTVDFSSAMGMELLNTSFPTVSDCVFDDNVIPLAGVPLTGLDGFTGCTAQNNSGGDYIEIVGSTVNSDVTLSAANTLNGTGVFVIDSNITVYAGSKLTLAPNTIIKLAGNHGISVTGELAIPTGPAWITSLADDEGGDTNASTAQPSPGDWGGITLNGAPLVQNLTVRYGGNAGVAAVLMQGNAGGLMGVTIENCAGPAIDVSNNSQPTVQNCTFDDNDSATNPLAIAELANFSGNTASGNAQGDVMHLSGWGGGATLSLGPAQSLNGSGTFVLDAGFTTASGATLTFEAGCVIKMAGAIGINAHDSLNMSGTAANPVVLTTINDDAYGLDTNGNGPAPMPGEWVGLSFASASDVSNLTHTIIRYAGAGNVPAVDLHSSDIVMLECIIEKCAGTAIHANETSTATLTNCILRCNNGMALDGMTWAALGNITGLQAYQNGGGQITEINSPLVQGHVKVEHHSYLGDAIVVTVSPDIMANGSNSLSFGEGVVLKNAPGVRYVFNSDCSIQGTPNLPVVMTSLLDDEHGGDTYGNPALAAPGDWGGIEGTLMPRVEHLLLRYAGENDPGINQPWPGIEGSISKVWATRVEHCAGHGIDVIGAITNCIAFSNGWNGIQGGNVSFCTSAYNGWNGITHRFLASATVWASIAWGNGIDDIAGLFYGVPPAGTFFTTSVVYSNGITPLPCGPPTLCPVVDYTIDVDPLFVDGPNGDLRLQPGSPCLDVVPLTAPIPGSTQGWTYDLDRTRQDIDGNSRRVDSDGTGPAQALSDMGAHESVQYAMTSTGLPQVGAPISWTVNGAPGTAYFAVGFGQSSGQYDPFGFLLVGDFNSFLFLGISPVGTPFSYVTPPIPGFPFALQALALPSAAPLSGSFTNYWKGTIYD